MVRDLLTSSFEQRRREEGVIDTPTLSPDCAEVFDSSSSLVPCVFIRAYLCLYVARDSG